ncbi:hypothetical protein Tco_0632012, partial [Tanacetum coccineum]
MATDEVFLGSDMLGGRLWDCRTIDWSGEVEGTRWVQSSFFFCNLVVQDIEVRHCDGASANAV